MPEMLPASPGTEQQKQQQKQRTGHRRSEQTEDIKGVHDAEEATTKREDGIKESHLIASPSHFCPEHSTSRAPVKTHTYDIYIKLLYIYIKLCLFSKKLQADND